MLAAAYDHNNVVSLLMDKYGQQDPTPKEVVSIYVAPCVFIYVIKQHIS